MVASGDFTSQHMYTHTHYGVVQYQRSVIYLMSSLSIIKLLSLLSSWKDNSSRNINSTEIDTDMLGNKK